MPNVVGKTASDAKAALKKSGFGYRYSAPKGSVVILAKNWTVTKQSPKAGEKVKSHTKIKLTVVKSSALKTSASPVSPTPTGPTLTVSQQQALLAAKGYLSSGMGFSYQGLIDQLSSPYGNGFDVADATIAVNSLNADWNAQAVAAAKGYLSSGQGFSHQSLVDQLTSAYGNKFTPEQAEYAVGQVGL
ncbi:Ltp family lipoprotein [Leifsonia xyli]|uniref:Ltp family lipoprotein n=1 Tax=Leifsonia xyli TaxID=1575 RepID=UPI003D6733C7